MEGRKNVGMPTTYKLLDHFSDPALVTDRDWLVLYANDRARQLFGAELDLDASCCLALLPSLAAYPALFTQLGQTLAERESWEGAEFAVGPDRRRADIAVERLVDGSPDDDALLWRFALKETPPPSPNAPDGENLYFNLAQLASDGICIVQDEIIRYANPQLCSMLQKPADEVVGTPFVSHIEGRNLEHLLALYRQHQNGARNLGVIESALCNRSGERIEVEIDAGIIPFAGRGATLVTLHNITDRVRAREALAESEARYRLVTENSADVIWSYDLTALRFTFVSQAIEPALGLKPEAVVGRDLHDFLPAAAARKIARTFDALLAKWPADREVSFEMDASAADGALATFEIVGTLLGEAGGAPTVATGVARDVSRRKKAERAASRRHAILRLQTDLASRFVALSSGELDAAIQDALDEICTFMGVHRAEVFLYRWHNGQRFGDAVYEWCAPGRTSQRDKLQNLPASQYSWVAQRIERGLPAAMADTAAPLTDAAAEQAWWRESGTRGLLAVPIVSTEGLLGLAAFSDLVGPHEWDEETVNLAESAAAVFGSAIQRERAEKALRRSEARYRQVTETSPDTIWSYDLTVQRFTFVSQAVERVLGLGAQEVIGRDLRQFLPASAARGLGRMFDALLAKWPADRRLTFELDFPTASGTTVTLEITGALLGDEGGSPAAATGVARDVTRRRAAERAAERNRELLELSAGLASRFLALSAAEVGPAINQTLAQIGVKADAQRAALLLFDRRGVLHIVHEWCAPGIASVKAQGAQFSFGPNERPIDGYLAGQAARIDDIERLPPEAAKLRDLWRGLGVKAGLSVPMMREGEALGVLALHDCRGPREWDEQTVALARNVAAIFASAVYRRQVDRALRRSEARYRQVTESSPDIIWTYDLRRRRFRFASPAMVQILGFSLREASEMALKDFFPPGGGRVVAAAFGAMLDKWPDERVATVEADHLAKDGRIVPLEIVGKAIAEEGERPTLVSGVSRDVTRRRAAERRAARHHELLQLVTELATRFVALEPEQAGAEVDQALARVGSFAAADRAVVFTRRPGTDVGDQTHEWCAPGVPSAKAGLQNLPPDRHPWVQRRLDADLPLVIPDVEQVPDEAAAERESWRRAGIKALAAVPITHRGSLIGVLGLNDCHGPRAWDEQTLALLQNVAVIFGNAMARAAADAALRRSNETARALLDGTDAVALLADCEGRLLACNRTTAKALGRPAEELLGQNGLALLPPSVRGVARDMLAEILRDRRPIRVEREFDRSWYLLSVTPVRGDGDEVARLALFARDITDIKNREIELRDALRRAQEAEVLKSRFLANMSHEIRTPLNHVIGMASVLLMQPEMPEDERVGCLKIVKRGGETMLALLTAILNLSKIESGKVEPNLAAFDFGEWAAGLRRRCDEMCAARRLAFRLWADPAIPATLMGDRAMIEQALEALVDNACKFTKRGGVDVSITLAELDGPAGAAQIAFAVADTGIGISAEDLPRVFDSFFQVDSSTTRELGGVGLGLTIARELARILGGRIEAVSTLGEGSVFTLFCPFRLREKDDAAE